MSNILHCMKMETIYIVIIAYIKVIEIKKELDVFIMQLNKGHVVYCTLKCRSENNYTYPRKPFQFTKNKNAALPRKQPACNFYYSCNCNFKFNALFPNIVLIDYIHNFSGSELEKTWFPVVVPQPFKVAVLLFVFSPSEEHLRPLGVANRA